MRNGFRIESVSDEGEYERNECSDWLKRFADEFEKQSDVSTTAVEVARHRNEEAASIFDQIHTIMNGGYTSNRMSSYRSVEEAVQDYQKRTGLLEYQKQAIAMQIIAESVEELKETSHADDSEEESSEKKNSKPALLDKNPAIDSYINNLIDTNNCVQIPAVLHNISSIFSRDGVSESELDDPELARYINNLIIEKRRSVKHTDDARLGRNLGIFNEDAGMVDNPWQSLMPATRRW